MNNPSRIQILQVGDCPLVANLIEDLTACLETAGISETVDIIVGDFPSPTLLIDGMDIVTGEPPTAEPRCRLDRPTRPQIQAAIDRLVDPAPGRRVR